MSVKTTNMHLKHVPQDIYILIRNEQHHLGLFKQLQLNREFVLYNMLREWYHFKNEHELLKARIKELELELDKQVTSN